MLRYHMSSQLKRGLSSLTYKKREREGGNRDRVVIKERSR